MKHLKQLGMIRSSALAAFLLTIIFFVSITLLHDAQAAQSYGMHYYSIPFNGESTMTMVLAVPKTSNAFNATDGTSTLTTTWAESEITGVQHSVTNDWRFKIPKTGFLILYAKVYHVAAASLERQKTLPMRIRLLITGEQK